VHGTVPPVLAPTAFVLLAPRRAHDRFAARVAARAVMVRFVIAVGFGLIYATYEWRSDPLPARRHRPDSHDRERRRRPAQAAAVLARAPPRPSSAMAISAQPHVEASRWTHDDEHDLHRCPVCSEEYGPIGDE
jgi:hypothetical protein